jgi:squalene-hopene/tetraprenyl-beta-curcumene cyclase
MLKRDAETKGLEFLKAHQNEDGSWQSPKEPPGITAIVVKAFVQDPKHNLRDPFLAKALERLKSYQNADGSVAEMLVTYNTAITVSAMAAAHDPALKESIAKAIAYLRSTEWTDKIEGINEKDPAYGGWGYTKKSRPDLSNVQTAIDALRDAGLKSDDPAFQTALKFITRSQNNSETNDQPWAGDDGSFIYTPANGGSSAAGESTGQRWMESRPVLSTTFGVLSLQEAIEDLKDHPVK